MKNSTKAYIGYCVSKVLAYALAFIAAIDMFMQFIINIDCFDSHCSVMGQYPEGLFFRLIGVPVILFVASIFARCITYLCCKWCLYERMQEKKRR